MSAPAGPPGRSLILSGPIAAAQVPMLCDRLAELLAGPTHPTAGSTAGPTDPAAGSTGGATAGFTAIPAKVAICLDVSRIVVNLEAVDVLARLQLTARRLGGCIALHGAAPQLVELVEICGLAGVLLRPGRGDPDPPAGLPP